VAVIEEMPPLMVLAESSPERMTFRFRGGVWGWFTLAVGAALVCVCLWLLLADSRQTVVLGLVGAFGLLLLLSSYYSFTADQFLVVDGTQRTVRFHKANLYGYVEWERNGDQFKEIHVIRADLQAANWSIALVGVDGRRLYIGENEFGSLSHERALAMATQVGKLAGIPVVDRDVRG
jgi:hypothetical protein